MVRRTLPDVTTIAAGDPDTIERAAAAIAGSDAIHG
jgi:hypothetical protein